MLHCARVSFPPLSPGVLAEERMRLEAPVPPDLVQVWQALGGARSDFQL
jgi:hypothetical protein